MRAVKRSAGVTPEVNPREFTLCMSPSSANKAALPLTQRRHICPPKIIRFSLKIVSSPTEIQIGSHLTSANFIVVIELRNFLNLTVKYLQITLEEFVELDEALRKKLD